jgi:two-component system response regulator AtoC
MIQEKMPNLAFQGLKVIVVDDDDAISWAIESELKVLGAETKRAATVTQAYELFPNFNPDIAICDLNFPDGDGLEILKRWKSDEPSMPIILITAHGAVDSAVTALRLGAFDYLQKPFSMHVLIAAVNRAAEVGHLRRRLSQYEGREKSVEPFTIVGDSQPMRKLRRMLDRVAKSKADTVLICGESGSGKELAARAIHEWSGHSQEPFVEINCASIPENLLESELFGFEKGAFTDARERKLGLFEIARSGTVFLDEIGEIPLKLQAKLLRVIEHRRFKRLGGTKDIEFKGRIVAATNRRLEEEVFEGNFRDDLFFRLDVVPLVVPPLRDRKEDIPVLVDYLLAQIAKHLEIGKCTISPEALSELMNHPWRGNVRELKNALQRTIIFHQPTHIEAEHLELRFHEPVIGSATLPTSVSSAKQTKHVQTNKCEEQGTLSTASDPYQSERGVIVDNNFVLSAKGISLENLERSVFQQALEMARYNQTKAAQLLGISRHTFRYRLEKFGLLEPPI